MVSKRLDKWRRDISEKRRRGKSKRYCIPMKLFNSKPPQKRMAKLKCSTYLPHIFSTFSSVFLWIFQMSKTQTVSITGRRMFASTLGRAKLFTPMNSSSAKIHESVARLLRPTHGFGCVAHKRIYSQWLGYKGIWCQVFFCSYPRKKCHGNPKGTFLVRRFPATSTAKRIASTCPDMRWNYTPASLQADANGLVQQGGSKRFNKTSRASELSTTESAASWEEDSRSSQTSGMKPTWSQVKNSLSQQTAKIKS